MNKILRFTDKDSLRKFLRTTEIPLPKLEIKIEGEVKNPGYEGWRGMSKQEQIEKGFVK